jgi:PIN domain nuclease of toxin-antitoxin system
MRNNFTKQPNAVIRNFRLVIIIFSVFVTGTAFAQSTTAIGTAKVWGTVGGITIEGAVQDPSAWVSNLQMPAFLNTLKAIFTIAGEGIQEAIAVIGDCREASVPISVSAVTAWEMGMLVASRRVTETRTAPQWYRDFLSESAFVEQQVTADIFMASCALPQPLHKDPIDRILIATAREHDLTIITRDRAILAYGAAGHVKTLAC